MESPLAYFDAIEKVTEWSKVYLSGGDISAVMEKQINEYLEVK